MKKLIILSILCALTLSIYSQNRFNKKPNKERVSWENLEIETEKAYYEGKLFNGIAYQEYYPNQLKGEWSFIDGEVNGKVKIWFNDGALKGIGKIKIVSGEIVSGEVKTLYDSGQLKEEKKWKDGEVIYEKCFNLEGIEIDCQDEYETAAEEGESEEVEAYEESNILSYPLAESQDSENIHILEIERNTDNYFDTTTVTKIHFIYTCSDLYLNGGWFNINKNINIKDSYGERQYSLLKAIGVPLSPEMKDCDFQNQIHSFILIFEAIDSDITMIDILECENTCFNFYGVNLEYTKE